MGDETPDRPDKLTPAQREQYEDRYIPGKLGRDEVPRSPDKWLERSAFWRAEWLAGRAFERGVDVVFGLPQAGWQAHVQHVADNGQQIYVDRYLPGDASKGEKSQNLEIKKGDLKPRDIVQMAGYADKLEKGEKVTYLMRASKMEALSPQAKQLIADLKKAYPDRFQFKAVSEKAFNRIFEAGLKVVREEQQQRLAQNVEKVPAREVQGLSIEQIAKDYLRDIEKARDQGREIGPDQMRFMNEALRDMNLAQTRIELDQAKEAREALGLRYHESRDVEKFLELQVRDKQEERAASIDKITHELIDREREELAKATREAFQQILDAREQGVALDPKQLREQHLALGNALGAVQKMEKDLFKDIAKDELAKGTPEQEVQQWQLAMDIIQKDRDHATAQEIDRLAEIAAREEKLRAETREGIEKAQREAELQRAAQQRDLNRLPPDIAKLLEVGQAHPPEAAARNRPDENTPQVTRGHRYGPGQSRGLERGGR